MNDNKIKVLNDREHVLLRPNMYIGSVNYINNNDFILSKDNIFEYKEFQIVPGLIKMFGEVIDNSIDEAIRTKFSYANKIDITVKSDFIEVKDNGRGIPIELEESTGKYGPTLAWTELKAGSNFESDGTGRETIGMNGVGVSLVNIMSKEFEGVTQWQKKRLTLNSANNMEVIDVQVKPKIAKPFTKVKFYPDFNRLEVKEIDDIHLRVMKQRIHILSIVYPKIKFTFNGKVLKTKNNKEFMNMFGSSYEVIEDEDWMVGVFPNYTDDFTFFSYVNALHMKAGGNHINMLTTDVCNNLRDKLCKKYKSIKPGDVKNKIKLIVMMKNFKNFETNSQTKESLDNSTSYIKRYLKGYSDKFDKFINKVAKNKDIVEPIVEVYKIKEEIKKKKELSLQDKKLTKKIKSKKFTPAIKGNEYIMIVEGESALGGLMPVLGREIYSYYELKGKPLNSYDITAQKLITNVELNDLRQILGISLVGASTNLNFKNVVFATDQDLDGFHIRGLLLAFFAKFGYSMIDNLKVLQTPVAIAKRGDRIKELFFSIDDINNYEPNDTGIKIHYKKGIGSWKKTELIYIFKNYDMKLFLIDFKVDKDAMTYIDDWFSKEKVEKRKEHLMNNKFSIANL